MDALCVCWMVIVSYQWDQTNGTRTAQLYTLHTAQQYLSIGYVVITVYPHFLAGNPRKDDKNWVLQNWTAVFYKVSYFSIRKYFLVCTPYLRCSLAPCYDDAKYLCKIIHISYQVHWGNATMGPFCNFEIKNLIFCCLVTNNEVDQISELFEGWRYYGQFFSTQ